MGIVINGNDAIDAYVSDRWFHCIYHFKLPNFKLVTKVGNRGPGKGEFSYPENLSVAPNGSVYIADTSNNRVVVMTNKLKFRQSISHESMTSPFDVKF